MPRSGFTDNTAIAQEHLIRLHYGDHGDDVVMHTQCLVVTGAQII